MGVIIRIDGRLLRFKIFQAEILAEIIGKKGINSRENHHEQNNFAFIHSLEMLCPITQVICKNTTQYGADTIMGDRFKS